MVEFVTASVTDYRGGGGGGEGVILFWRGYGL